MSRWGVLLAMLLTFFIPAFYAQCDYYCSSALECANAILSAVSGKVVCLTADLSSGIDIENVDLNANIIFDCQGHVIAGPGYDDGIALRYVNANGLIIRNCVITNFGAGVFVDGTDNLFLQDITSFQNHTGIHILNSTVALQNIIARDNSLYDIYLYTDAESKCPTYASNIIGSRGKPILLLTDKNSGVVIDGDTNVEYSDLAELIICNADNVTIKNVTVCGAACGGGPMNNGAYVYFSNNLSLEDINSSNNLYGLYVRNTNNLSLQTLVAIDNGVGLFVADSNALSFRTVTCTGNSYDGLEIWDTNNTVFSNVTSFRNGRYGLFLYNTPLVIDLTLSDSAVCDNAAYDLYLDYDSNLTCVNCDTGHHFFFTTTYFVTGSTVSCDCNQSCSLLAPDLRLISIIPSNLWTNPFLVGTIYVFDVNVCNLGLASGDGNVSLYVNGYYTNSSAFAIYPGECNIFTLYWTPSAPGTDLNFVLYENGTYKDSVSYSVSAYDIACSNDIDGDSNTEYLLDSDDPDTNPEYYYDPDTGIVESLTLSDYDNDGNTEYGIPSLNAYYDPDTNSIEYVSGRIVSARVPAVTAAFAALMVLFGLVILLLGRYV